VKLTTLLAPMIAVYVAILFPLATYQRQKPFLEKVGYVPQPFVIKALSGDQKNAVAASLISQVLIYYGTLVEKNRIDAGLPPDHETMQATLLAASRLDPYNMDIYYFAQSVAWDCKKVPETIALLEYGISHRDWDFYLPFFAGFDYAFFLKDYAKAAPHFATAARLSGSDLFGRLASRYMYEAGQTEMAINYLATMIKNSHNEAMRKTFAMRHAALLEVRRIELARDRYQERFGRLPGSLDDLYAQDLLLEPATDPYGGKFYLEESGTVRSTSKFSNDIGEKP